MNAEVFVPHKSLRHVLQRLVRLFRAFSVGTFHLKNVRNETFAINFKVHDVCRCKHLDSIAIATRIFRRTWISTFVRMHSNPRELLEYCEGYVFLVKSVIFYLKKMIKLPILSSLLTSRVFIYVYISTEISRVKEFCRKKGNVRNFIYFFKKPFTL